MHKRITSKTDANFFILVQIINMVSNLVLFELQGFSWRFKCILITRMILS